MKRAGPVQAETPAEIELLAKFGLGPDFEPLPFQQKKEQCPRCGRGNAYWKEIHPDTSMNEIVLYCPDCGYEGDGRNDSAVNDSAETARAEMSKQAPERLVRAMGPEVEVDVPNRILRRAQFATRRIASDGGIVMPEGLDVHYFEQNPVVLARHGLSDSAEPPIIGRSLSVQRNHLGLESATQFADTALGREYAYLYGVNAEREVYARGWSFGWTTTDLEWWDLDVARAWLGRDWDEASVPPWVMRDGQVWVAKRAILNEYSAVPLGADKAALSRAYMDKGVPLAGRMVAAMDLAEARDLLGQVRDVVGRVDRLEEQLKALSRDDAPAARQGDSGALLAEIRAVVREWKGQD